MFIHKSVEKLKDARHMYIHVLYMCVCFIHIYTHISYYLPTRSDRLKRDLFYTRRKRDRERISRINIIKFIL